MRPVLYQINGPLTDGRYLPGEYKWPVAVVLTRAELDCWAGARGTLTLTLEVGGVLTGESFQVGPENSRWQTALQLLAYVPANTLVRWKASFTGSAEDAPTQMAVVAYPFLPADIINPALRLNWVNGWERWPLFNYDPATGLYTQAPGAIQSRVTLTQGATFSVVIDGVESLRVAGGIFYANDFDVRGVASADRPQVQFVMGGTVLAMLTGTAFYLPDLTEGAPAALVAEDPNYFRRFSFLNNGNLEATLDGDGLTANQLTEGMPE